MKKLMNILFLSCKKATGLIEKKNIIGLNRREQTQLILHTSMCKACKKYGEHSQEIDNLVKNHTRNYAPQQENKPNNDDFKDKIIKSL